ncbi:hypothetical protein [Luteimonas sp. A478]
MIFDATSIVLLAVPLIAGIFAFYVVRQRPRWKRPLAWMGAGVVFFFLLKLTLEFLLDIA